MLSKWSFPLFLNCLFSVNLIPIFSLGIWKSSLSPFSGCSYPFRVSSGRGPALSGGRGPKELQGTRSEGAFRPNLGRGAVISGSWNSPLTRTFLLVNSLSAAPSIPFPSPQALCRRAHLSLLGVFSREVLAGAGLRPAPPTTVLGPACNSRVQRLRGRGGGRR